MDELFDVSKKVVVVSGGSRGIGLALAEAFALRGATVVITGRDAARLNEAAQQVAGVQTQVCDVTNADAVAASVKDLGQKIGRIDTWINCAGVNIRKPAVDYTADEFDAIINTNLRGAFLAAQAVGRIMIGQKEGSIINIDSLSSFSSLPHVAPYGMAKSGLSSMTRALATEWGRDGVRVNGIAPGFILTDLTGELWLDPNLQSWNRAVTPLGRMGSVEDLVGAAIFLASPASTYVTGQTLRVDGGISAGIAWPIDGSFEVKMA